MKLINNFSALFIGVSAVLFLTACKKPNFDKIATDAWSPTIAVPVAKATYGVDDVLKGKDSAGLIQTDADGALTLIYSIEQELARASDFLTLPATSQSFSDNASNYGVPPSPTFVGTESITINEEADLSAPQGFKLFNIDFEDGLLIIAASTTLMHDVEFQFSFPDLLENGTPAARTINLIYQIGQVSEGSDTIDLSVCTMDLTNGSAGFNQFRVNADITITGTGNPLTGTESIDFSLELQDPSFDLILGDFGQQDIFDFMDTIDIKLFDNFEYGNIQFTNPQIGFFFRNSFGVPIGLNFDEVKTIEESTGNQLLLTGFPTNFVIEAPNVPGLEETSSIILNKNNTSNIQQIVSPSPKKLIFDIGGGVNPAGPATNFISSSSALSTEIELVMPLEGFASGFQIKDTQDISLDLPDFLEFAEFKIQSNNGFPLSLEIDLILLDENENELFSLTDGFQDLVVAAPVDANGRVIDKVENSLEIRVENSQLEDLRLARRVIIVAKAETYDATNGTSVKLYNDYEIDINLGLKGQATFNN